MTAFTPNHLLADTRLFNEISKKTDNPVNLQSIRQQCQLIKEEVLETVDSASLNNPVGVLDVLCDVLVTAFGLLQQLEQAGFDVSKAMQKVGTNNLSKFVHDPKLVDDCLKFYGDKQETVYAEFNPKHQCFVIKDSSQKVRKPVNFKSVDLSDCIPDNLKGGFSV